MRIYYWIIPLLVVRILSSCSTFVSGSYATVMLDGELSDTLTVQSNAAVYPQAQLPISVSVDRGRLKEPIVLKKRYC